MTVFSQALAEMSARLPLADIPPVQPSGDGLPGESAISTLLSWAMYLALAACILGGIGAGGAIGLGSVSNRANLVERGKIGLLCAVVGAIVVGSAVTLVNTGFGLA